MFCLFRYVRLWTAYVRISSQVLPKIKRKKQNRNFFLNSNFLKIARNHKYGLNPTKNEGVSFILFEVNLRLLFTIESYNFYLKFFLSRIHNKTLKSSYKKSIEFAFLSNQMSRILDKVTSLSHSLSQSTIGFNFKRQWE